VTDFDNSFADRLGKKFATKPASNFSSCLKRMSLCGNTFQVCWLVWWHFCGNFFRVYQWKSFENRSHFGNDLIEHGIWNTMYKSFIDWSTDWWINCWLIQVIGDLTELPGERCIKSMLYDSNHEQLITGSSVIEVLPLSRAAQAAIQIPHTHDRPLVVVGFIL